MLTNTVATTAVERPTEPPLTYTVIDTPEALGRIWPVLTAGHRPIALDVETYGDYRDDALDPHRGEVRLLTVMVEGGTPVIFDLRALGYYAAPWSELFQGREVIAHNLRFDAAWLAEKLDVHLPKVFCTLTASRLLSNGTDLRNDLESAIERFLGIQLAKGQGGSDWGGLFLTDEQLRYAAADVAHLHALRAALTESLKATGLWNVFELEAKLLPTVVRMQDAGMPVSRATLQAILDEATARRRSFEPELKRHLGEWKNFSSYDQIREAFEEIGIPLEDTAFETLKPLSHPAAKTLLQYREADMERRQAESLLQAVRSDNRIHGQFKPIGPETGRFASTEPNLQNVKAGGRLRSVFAPPSPDRVLVVADYSQIELRAAAWLSKDPEMLNAFQRGDDLHAKTAAAVLNKPVEEVTKQDRKLAKGCNFGLIFGQKARGFVNYMFNQFDTSLTVSQAEGYIAAFFGLYRGLARWHREAWAKAPKVTEGRTITGRRRLIPGDAPDWKRFQAQVNFVVQGSCADGLKLAMVDLARVLPTEARLIATVHDELLVECPRGIANDVLRLTQSTMVEACTGLFPGLPIQVDAKVCNHWGEK